MYNQFKARDHRLTTNQCLLFIVYTDALNEETKAKLSSKKKPKSNSGDAPVASQQVDSIEIILSFKRFIYDTKKAMRQT